MASFARSVVLAVAGGVTSKAARRLTRRVMHDRVGVPRLPRPVRNRDGAGTALLLAAGTGAFLALADVLKEQKKHAVRRA